MSKPIGYCKAIPRGMCIVINIYNRERKRERERGGWKENGKKEGKKEGRRKKISN